MNGKPIIPRERANRDIDNAIDHHPSEAGEEAALGFIAALEQAWRQQRRSGIRSLVRRLRFLSS